MNLLKAPILQAVQYASIQDQYKKAFPHWDDKDIIFRWKDEFTQIGDYSKVITKLKQLIKKLDWAADIHLHKVMTVAIQLITKLVPTSDILISLNELYFVVLDKNLLSVDTLLRQKEVAIRCSLLKQLIRRRQWSDDVGMQKLIHYHLTFTPCPPALSRKLERLRFLFNQIQLHNILMRDLLFDRPRYKVYSQGHGSTMTKIIELCKFWRNSILTAQEFLLTSSAVIPNKKEVIYNSQNIYRLLEYLEKKMPSKEFCT